MAAFPTKPQLDALLSALGPLAGGFTGAPVPRVLSCREETQTITLAYDLAPWMVNPGGMVHGGLITALMDSAFGTLIGGLNGGTLCPTMSLTTNYLSSARVELPLEVAVSVDRMGRVAAHLSARCSQEGKLVATGSAVFSLASPRGKVEDLSQ